jgi:hypothetical protein
MKGASDMSEKGNHVNRREFIATSSLAVAGLSVPSVALHAASKPAILLPISVGFWSAGAEVKGRKISSQTAFDPAKSIASGDPSLFSRGARFAFRGLHRSVNSDSLAVMIDVIYEAYDGTKAPFFAFTHVEGRGHSGSSSRTAFNVPVPTQGAIDLAVRARRGSGPESGGLVSFAVNTAEGALKLNRGVYVFALGDRAPAWPTITMAAGANADTFSSSSKPLLVSRIDGRDVDFDYIVMTVDAASRA